MTQPILVPADLLESSLRGALEAAGADAPSVAACTRALMHASRIGVDSHGVRLVVHYARVLGGGRVNARPQLTTRRTAAATAIVDGDHGLGHRTGYAAMEEAVSIAKEVGIGAVGAVRSSHFGAAGAYALAAAEAGLIGFATTNTDSCVTLFEGTEPFHGTNPLAFAAPNGTAKPWLLDMATSSIPLNRVFLYRTLGLDLPPGVAANQAGEMVRDPNEASMLLPLGGADFGFKGAALAGLATILSGILQGATLDQDFIAMDHPTDIATPRGMGHFFLAIDPEKFGGTALFAAGMAAYLGALRSVPPREGGRVMAPGDREWEIEIDRARDGIPVDPKTAAFLGLA